MTPSIADNRYRDLRFAALDALIAKGFGDTPGNKIPKGALLSKESGPERQDYNPLPELTPVVPCWVVPESKPTPVFTAGWNPLLRTLTRSRCDSRKNDVSSILIDTFAFRPRLSQKPIGPDHEHHWIAMGNYDGRKRFRCKGLNGCGRTYLDNPERRKKELGIAKMIEDGGRSMRAIGREIGSNPHTVIRIRKKLEAGVF